MSAVGDLVVGRVNTGRVRATDGSTVVVALEDATLTARNALPLYRPGLGDEVLLVQQRDQVFVIGVLQIAGPAELVAPGRLSVRAAGAMDFVSAEHARLSGPRVTLEASALTVIARSVTERFERARRWVRDCLQIRAGRMRADVDGSCETQAGNIVQCADGAVRIDGASIDLG